MKSSSTNSLAALFVLAMTAAAAAERVPSATLFHNEGVEDVGNPGRALLQLQPTERNRTRPEGTRDEDSDAPAFIEGERGWQGLTLVRLS
jgi:hypothetical protein